MTQQHTLAQQYLDAWNEADAQQRDAQLRRLLTPDATYTDPQMTGHGPDGIGQMIGAARTQLPGLSFRLRGSVETHHDTMRFSWALGPDADTAVAGGTDVVVLDGGRMRQIIGFIDFAPASG
ncbi:MULTISPECIES: nuclear transport factor 2 family protein [Deinococcus]|uniref:Nuclear transport factor 2 family protein n=1 Tax=Deinococcus rufus TaxID=2136097 RepID=A0ABV7Z349_9DEIO|nr:nuclear transport factor 2 family protein [Deinococcus sp. AB2017081]WQE96036.1 nuclear transport factor 2 family protein [Deinococcus sp. AB2017081]